MGILRAGAKICRPNLDAQLWRAYGSQEKIKKESSMTHAASLLLRCPNRDHRFEFDPSKLALAPNRVQCPGCQQHFAVRVTFVVEKIVSVVPSKT